MFLYVIACGSPMAAEVHILARLARARGWEVSAVVTERAAPFIDLEVLAEAAGRPVRTGWRRPADRDYPDADAIVAAPATFNTVNKWTHGIADTLASAILCEYLMRDVPIVVVPKGDPALDYHPAFRESLRKLDKWGVRVLFNGNGAEPSWETIMEELVRAIEGPPRQPPG